MRLTELKKTCSACPSQWEGRTDDGRYLYARFRWGYLMVAVAPTMDEAVWPNENAEILCELQVGDDLDGVMSTEEMLAHAGFSVTKVIER